MYVPSVINCGLIIKNNAFNVNPFLAGFTVNSLDTHSASSYTYPTDIMLFRPMIRGI